MLRVLTEFGQHLLQEFPCRRQRQYYPARYSQKYGQLDGTAGYNETIRIKASRDSNASAKARRCNMQPLRQAPRCQMVSISPVQLTVVRPRSWSCAAVSTQA